MASRPRQPGEATTPSHPNTERALDPLALFYEVGRQVQAVPYVMRRHRMVETQQLCECGRVPVRVLPVFGLRCEVACAQWDLTHHAMLRIVQQTAGLR